MARGRRLPARGRAGLGVRRAVAAVPEDLMPVAVDDEADLGRDLVLDALDLRARELEDLTARLADEVVVVLALVLALEARLALEHELLGQARRLQQLERAVDGRAPDVAAPLLHEVEEVVHGEV